MRTSAEKDIGGKPYTLILFSGTKATKIFARLTKLFGPAAGPVMATLFQEGGLKKILDKQMEEMAVKVMPEIIKSLAERLEEEMVVNTVKEILDGVLCEGQPIQFDTHFAGKMGLMFKVVLAQLMHNYGDLKNE